MAGLAGVAHQHVARLDLESVVCVQGSVPMEPVLLQLPSPTTQCPSVLPCCQMQGWLQLWSGAFFHV